MESENTDTCKAIWSFKFVGYLYTEIIELDGAVYFGTAGQGGHFYGLDIKSGLPVLDINTHGTAMFEVYKNKILLPSEYGDLLAYDTRDASGVVLNAGNNCFIIDDVKFFIEDNKLYTVIAERCGERLEYYLACIDLEN